VTAVSLQVVCIPLHHHAGVPVQKSQLSCDQFVAGCRFLSGQFQNQEAASFQLVRLTSTPHRKCKKVSDMRWEGQCTRGIHLQQAMQKVIHFCNGREW
jgi:hypothetical protein